jgi:UDP-glucuronate 4-epimerase
MKEKVILITGAAGFIGSSLATKLLANGYKIVGIDNFDNFYDPKIKKQNINELLNNKNFVFYEIDIRDASKLSSIKENVDIIVHLAAKAGVLPSINSPQEYISVNINGTRNILDFMRLKDIKKMVFASSSSVYGNNEKVPFAESDNVDYPISPYAFTKKTCELMNYTYHHLYQLDIINLRFFTVYGPKQRPDLAIHKFVKLIMSEKPIEMYGDGSSARDYTYIDDIVDGIERAIEYVLKKSNLFEIINIGNNNPVTIKDLISTIYNIMGKIPNIKKIPAQPGDVNITYADITKAKRILDYKPSTELSMGLKKFIDWRSSIKNDKKNETE